MALPTIEFVKSKANEIKKALNYNFTSDDVDKIVAEKEKFKKNPINYAMHKSRLIKDKEIALANGDDERARELEQKLNELEERAEELDKKRTSTMSSIALINDRNRKANVSKAEAAIRMEIKQKSEEGTQENPFARKKCNPRMVTKVVTNTTLPTVSNSSNVTPEKQEQKENIVKIADISLSAQKRAKPEQQVDPEDPGGKKVVPVKKKAKFGSGLPLAMQKEDLFDAHNFDIDIDVDTSLTSSSAPAGGGAPAPAPMTTTPINTIKPPSSKDGSAKRSLNLDAYKKKRGLI